MNELLLGGAVSEVHLTSWDRLPSGAALADDAMSVASDDLSVVSAASSAESQSGPQQYLFVYACLDSLSVVV
jgi:hypothetical protein